MRRRRTALAVALFLLGPVSVLAQDHEPERVLTGRVTADDDIAIAGALVEFNGLTTTTDEQGKYQLLTTPNVPDPGDRGIVTASADGYGTAKEPKLPDEEWVQFTLLRPTAITSRVIDEATDELVHYAMVTVFVRAANRFVSKGGRATDGTLTVEDLPPGRMTLVGRAAGFAPTVIEDSIFAGTHPEYDIKLVPGAWVAGRVVYENGTSTEGVRVRVSYPSGVPGREFLAGLAHGSMVADPDGRFEIGGLQPGSLTVYAELGGTRSASQEVEALSGEALREQEVLLVLPPD